MAVAVVKNTQHKPWTASVMPYKTPQWLACLERLSLTTDADDDDDDDDDDVVVTQAVVLTLTVSPIHIIASSHHGRLRVSHHPRVNSIPRCAAATSSGL